MSVYASAEKVAAWRGYIGAYVRVTLSPDPDDEDNTVTGTLFHLDREGTATVGVGRNVLHCWPTLDIEMLTSRSGINTERYMFSPCAICGAAVGDVIEVDTLLTPYELLEASLRTGRRFRLHPCGHTPRTFIMSPKEPRPDA